jgi:hypothetical protein
MAEYGFKKIIPVYDVLSGVAHLSRGSYSGSVIELSQVTR